MFLDKNVTEIQFIYYVPSLYANLHMCQVSIKAEVSNSSPPEDSVQLK